MIRRAVKKVADIILPPGSAARHEVRKLRENLRAKQSSSLSYEEWTRQIEPSLPAPVVDKTGYSPLISIVIPAFNTPDKYLSPLLDSVIGQSYDNWEIVLVQASTVAERAEAIRLAAKRDERIKVIELEKNEGIARNTNAGIQAAQGDFIAFTDHDDTLSPHALAAVVEALQDNPRLSMFYSDEDKISDDGAYRSLPLFKPAWSPELFYSVNYLAHFIVVKADLVREVGGIRLGYDGAQDYDFLLRIISLKPEICAISRMSYHWRQAEGSTGLNLGEKTYASDAGLRALTSYVDRSGFAADVTEVEGRPTEYRLKYRVQGEPVVAILPTSQMSPTAQADLQAKTDYRKVRFIATQEEARAGELLLRIAPAAVPLATNWLTELIGLAQQPDIGWAGAALVTSDGRSAGIGYAEQAGEWEPMFSGVFMEEWTFMGPAVWPRNVTAVNLNCALIEVDKLMENGLRHVYWPYSRVQYDTLLSPISLPLVGPSAAFDRWINPNLKVKNGRFVLAKHKH